MEEKWIETDQPELQKRIFLAVASLLSSTFWFLRGHAKCDTSDENAYPKCTHIGFGLVLGEDEKKIPTHSREVVRLIDLLDEAKRRCKTAILELGEISA
ncbi:hypothetical protein JHK87_004492 [Glycine soja]|nr:hypothetical protein JHK87_004492 [Glycine soja]